MGRPGCVIRPIGCPVPGVYCPRYVTKGEIHMARRKLYLPVMIAATTVALACAVALLLAVSEQAEATFPGKNGRIAYSAYDGNDYEIYTIDSRGGAKRKETNNNRDDYSPSYSPRGKRIAYVKLDGNDTEIYTIKVGVRTETKLTQNNADEAAPSYSPDGKKIAYMVYSNATGNTQIYTIYVGGGGKTRVTSGGQPSFSPDGKKIVYAGLEGLERNNAESDIYKIKVGGGAKTKLTNNNNRYDTYPTFSPDGKKIAYTVSKGKAIRGDIYTINAFGGGKTQLTHNNADEFQPSWGSRN